MREPKVYGEFVIRLISQAKGRSYYLSNVISCKADMALFFVF